MAVVPSSLPPFPATCNRKLGSQDQGSKVFRLLNCFLQRESSSQRRTGNQIRSLQGPKMEQGLYPEESG